MSNKKTARQSKSSAPRMAESGMVTAAFVLRREHLEALRRLAQDGDRTVSAQLRRLLDAALTTPERAA